jgi:hypothetical protein
METKPETENEIRGDTAGSRSLERVVRRRRIRAKLSTATELDGHLCQLQDEGHQVYNILTFVNSVKGGTLDTGHGKGEIGMTMEPNFIITYGEAS